MKVAVIGGGMMGLASAFYLSQQKCEVTLFEKEQEVGGLSKAEEFIPGHRWDRYYHVILSTDSELLSFIDEIGLSLDVHFTETKTGFFTNGELHSMSTTLEFIQFKPLSLWQKFRLGAGILYASRIHDSSRLEKLYAKNWLITVFGRRIYEKIWDPLLRSKFGDAKDQASGSFIWSCITRYYGTREKSSKKEMMGVVKGGYYSILNRIKSQLIERGVKIHRSNCIRKIVAGENKQITLIDAHGDTHHFDKVLSAVPSPEFISIWPDIPDDYREMLSSVDYLRLICVNLVLKKSLSPYYVTNLTDPGFPFTGFIDATNIIPTETLNGNALIYLPRYLPPDDPYYHRSDAEVLADFLTGVRRIFPTFSESDILSSSIHREQYVQPIQKINYSKSIPSITTPIDNLFIVNTTMIVNSTLNNNQVIMLARKASDLIANPKRDNSCLP
ncbi:NAD(P)/FAD-dependent oxidoreductase [Desulfopila sp. IMCC35006]|uniref:NAD(P)/FAD-dependent oxidoreductase n=1 Tax=Desulfopila sp. IMCC35006 TaxID=2569542 RepID=UPI0010AB5E19|nr:NAD(P)/FAD-dependent oxidoreductase [Desulfopila sp. IMCC35006]TKB23967.1 NAD(P)/FAD-dependent oxidoreductase [Desulfopila sp. IMCC35006]